MIVRIANPELDFKSTPAFLNGLSAAKELSGQKRDLDDIRRYMREALGSEEDADRTLVEHLLRNPAYTKRNPYAQRWVKAEASRLGIPEKKKGWFW